MVAPDGTIRLFGAPHYYRPEKSPLLCHRVGYAQSLGVTLIFATYGKSKHEIPPPALVRKPRPDVGSMLFDLFNAGEIPKVQDKFLMIIAMAAIPAFEQCEIIFGADVKII